MKIIRVAMPPQEYGGYGDEPLREYNLDEIDKNIRIFAYWYGVGSYCGTGQAIFQCEDGKWNQEGLSHCSCNGPTEGLGGKQSGVYATFDELVERFSDELRKECAGIIEAIQKELSLDDPLRGLS